MSNATAVATGYDTRMSFVPAGHLAAAMAPLRATYGSRLTMCRDGSAVRWTLEGRAAIVEVEGERSVCVTFVERATRDSISEAALAPLYRAKTPYRLIADGAGHLARDMAAFFSGAREPRFRFAGFEEREPIRS
jgi:hypothetical protein